MYVVREMNVEDGIGIETVRQIGPFATVERAREYVTTAGGEKEPERWEVEELEPPDGESHIRVVIDISGGLFNCAYANVPMDIIAIDEDDGENQRACVPGFGHVSGRPIWADNQDAEVDPVRVNKAFDGIKWLESEEG